MFEHQYRQLPNISDNQNLIIVTNIFLDIYPSGVSDIEKMQ